ncbi:MAG: GtrA family protein [Deltaproteobacteria bacterium]|nr:GtrA family protein [Deltaproteobacteria bacterium]
MKFISRELIRFILVGGLNTAITYGIYLLLLLALAYPLAYSGSYVLGIFISYYLNTKFVFKQKPTITKALQFPLVYVVQYLLGVALLYVLVTVWHMDQRLAPVVIVLLTIPVTFLLSRVIIKGRFRLPFRGSITSK